LEKFVHGFSNILGINQMRFFKGNTKEAYGDLLAVIKRENLGNEINSLSMLRSTVHLFVHSSLIFLLLRYPRQPYLYREKIKEDGLALC